MAKLTKKQQRFVDEYLIDLNATQAAIRAGYSVKTAQEQGSQNLSKLMVQQAIEEQMAERSKRTEITQDKVLRELAAIAFAKATDYASVIEKQAIYTTDEGVRIPLHDENGNAVMIQDVQLVLTDTLNDAQKTALAGIKHGKYGIEVTMCSKEKALELLGRHLGMFKDKIELSGIETEKSKLDDIILQMRAGKGNNKGGDDP